MGRQVDDDVVPGDGGGETVAVEQRHRHRFGAERADQLGLVLGAGDGGDVVAGGDEALYGAPPDDAGTTGDEDPHRLASCIQWTDLRMDTGEAAPATCTTRSSTDTAASSARQAASAARITLVIVHGAR